MSTAIKKGNKSLHCLMTKKENDRCPYCLCTKLRPKGWNSKRTKKRLKCDGCKRHLVCGGKSWFVSDSQIELVDALLLERLSLRGICRVVKISLCWLMKYMAGLYESQPDNLNYRIPTNPQINLQLIDCELDEMWSFVHRKKNKKWIWIAQCRKTRQVVAFHVGDRSRDSAKELWKKIPSELRKRGYFYSDDWDAYKGIFPKERHKYSQIKKDTNHLERLNNTIRQRVSRLVRKTLSFSKKLENHIGAIKYFFCNYNLEQQYKWDKYEFKKKSAHL
jgi:IS1 family transposase